MSEFVYQSKTVKVGNRPKSTISKVRQFWLGIAVSVISLAGVVFVIEPDQILVPIRSELWERLLLGGLFIALYMVLRAVRWRYLLNNSAPLGKVFHIQNIGYMLTQLLPFRVGDAARAVLIGQSTPASTSQGFSTMVVERLLDILLMVFLLPLIVTQVTAVPDWLQSTARLSGFLAGLGMLVLVVLAGKRPLARQLAAKILNPLPIRNQSTWLDRLDDLLAGLNVLTRWRTGLTVACLSVLTWIPIILAYAQIMQAVHLQPTAAMAIFVMVAGAFSVAAPSSPGQIGVFHAGVTAAMALLGQPVAPSASLAVLYHAVNFSVMGVLGLTGLIFVNVRFGRILAGSRPFSGNRAANIYVSKHKDEHR
jgi:uncharacterized protein (TIRG00374 family)